MGNIEKKKSSFFGIFFKVIFSIVLLAVFAAVGLGIFIRVKHDINPLAIIGQSYRINQPADTAKIVTNPYSAEDLSSANTTIDAIDAQTVYIALNEKEVAAFVNQNLQLEEEVLVKFGADEVNLKDYGFALLEYKFTNIPETPSEHYANVNFVVKINLQKYKDAKISHFPASMFKGLVPNELYFSVSASVDKSTEDGAGAFDYKITSSNLRINTLDNEESENVFKMFNALSGIGTASNFAKNLAELFVGKVLGDSGLYGMLAAGANPAQGYAFETAAEQNNFVVYFVDTAETHTISFSTSHGQAEPIEYNITYNTITLPVIEADGYTFDGWFADVGGVPTKFEKIDIRDNFEDMTFSAHWSAITYTISYSLNGGELSGTYKTEYTIEDADFVLPTPTKQVGDQPFIFKGWAGTGIDGVKTPVTIYTGTFGNLSFVAYYEGETRAVSVVVNGKTYNTTAFSHVDVGSAIAREDFDTAEIGLAGFSINAWYTNSGLTQEYDFSSKIFEDITLYGDKFVYITNNVLFADYLGEFNNALSSRHITANSRAKLVAYIDFVVYNNIKTNVTIYIPYVNQNTSAIRNEFEAAFNEYRSISNKFTVGFKYSYGYYPTSATFYISESTTEVTKQEFLTADITYAQQDYAYKLVAPSSREENFDDFKINNVPSSLSGLISSEQVVWAMENGYKPICVANSEAERTYNKAKEILREICDDDMDDITKLKAIYEWLILSVDYDYDAASWLEGEDIKTLPYAQRVEILTERNSTAHNYYAWSAEGALLHGRAVCEGFAKSLLIMARLEGIPCIYVTGNGHAWNKVYIAGEWYGIDATHGNPGNESKQMETLSYVSFLFTDEQKENMGFEVENYTDNKFAATAEYNEYERDYDYLGTAFDLVINDRYEFARVLSYVANYETEIGTYYTVNVMLMYSSSGYFNTWLTYALGESGLSKYEVFTIQDGRAGTIPNGGANPNHNNLTYTILLYKNA